MNIDLKISNKVFLKKYRPYAEDYSHRYEVFWGGRGSGKTKFIIQKLVLKSLKEKRSILLMRKETNKLKDSLWKDLINVLDEWHLYEYFDVNKSEMRIISSINNSEFKCLGLDDSEKIKGYSEASDIFIDEVTAFSMEDFEQIDGTLRSTKYKLPLQLIVSFNPVSKASWVYTYFCFDIKEVPDDTLIVHSTYLDNKYLDKSYLKRMEDLKEKNYTRWKIEAQGEWATLNRLVYTNWEIKDFDYKDYLNKSELCVGLDFGFATDPTAIVLSLVTEDTIYIYKEDVSKGLTNPKIAEKLKYLGLEKSVIIADSSEPKSIEELKREGIRRIKPARKGPDSIRQGIQKVQQYHIVVHPSCENVILELENYCYQKDRASGEYINTPIDSYNHCLDALRYSLQCIAAKRRLKTIKKIDLGL